jgi:hypothetical protein
MAGRFSYPENARSGSNFQMADKSLAVEFRKPWNLLAEFNSARSTPLAADGENDE